MLSCQYTPDRNIQSGVLPNQAVKDEKEKEECNEVETLRLDPAPSGGVAALLQPQPHLSRHCTLTALIGHRTHELWERILHLHREGSYEG